jgi:hypothetical protein
MAVFRLHLRPSGVDPAQVTQFCLERCVIGCGWRLADFGQPDRLTDGNADFDEFWSAAEKYWENQDHTERDRWWDGFSAAANSFGRRVHEGDFCWTRGADGNYWLCRVTAKPFRYRTGDDWDTYDIHMTRSVEWLSNSLTPDQVPGFIRLRFLRQGRAIEQIHHPAVHELCDGLFLNRRDGQPLQAIPNLEIWDLLGAEEGEDLVSLYLQIQHGWHVVVSTAKISTRVYECVFRNKMGMRAALQVKMGATPFEIEQPPAGFDQFFIFNGNRHIGPASPKVSYISRDELLQFAKAHLTLLPPMVLPYL